MVVGEAKRGAQTHGTRANHHDGTRSRIDAVAQLRKDRLMPAEYEWILGELAIGDHSIMIIRHMAANYMPLPPAEVL